MHLMDRLGLAAVVLVAACGGGGGGGGGVTNPPPGQTLGSIALGSASLDLAAGAQASLSPTALDTQGATIVTATGFTYASAIPTIAAVGSNGLVTGLSAGQTTVTASLTFGGVSRSATATVTVTGTLPVTARVVANDVNVYDPTFVAVARGGTVTWSFLDTVHNVTFNGGAGAPGNIGDTSNNAGISRTFTSAGTFSYTCTLHSGMNGTVLVP
jgi:plastocyanin